MSTTTQALHLDAPSPLGRSPQNHPADTPVQPRPLPAATPLDDAELRMVAGGPAIQNGSL